MFVLVSLNSLVIFSFTGKIYAMSKNYKEAEKFLETAQQLNETNSETQLLLDKLKVLKRH